MATVEVIIEKERNSVLQGDIVIVDWQEGTRSVYYMINTHYDGKNRKALLSLDCGGCLCHYTDLGDITVQQLQLKFGAKNKITVIKRDEAHITIQRKDGV